MMLMCLFDGWLDDDDDDDDDESSGQVSDN